VAGAIRNYESPEEGFMPHPLLAATRSEMAVPIAIGNQVFGVLDVRSDQLNRFDEADLQTVTTLASQVAVALQNARSYTRSEKAIQELQELSRRLTREGWNEFFERQVDELAYRYDVDQVSAVADSDEESEADTEIALTQPLQIQGESIGELLLGSAKLNKDEAAEIVAAVAERLSAHLENLRLTRQTQYALNETQLRTEELAVLNEMSQSLTAQTTVDGVFHIVYDYLSRLMDTTDFFTVMYDEERDEVEFVLTASGEELRWYTEKRQAGHGVTEYIIRQRQPLLMPENVGQRLEALGIEGYGNLPESWLGAPLILGDRVLGMIGLESYTTPRLYNEQHLNLLTAVANQAAIAIESTRLLQSTVALAEEEQILRQITTRVSAAIDAESILRTAAEEIGRALGLEGYVSLETAGSNGTNGHESAAKLHGRTDAS
jgi:GAF domain-containing protein